MNVAKKAGDASRTKTMVEVLQTAFSEFSLMAILLLLVAALIAGFIDTLVGGGGLITIPALLAAGVPPIAALGTNKLQACAGSGTATLTLVQKGKVSLNVVKWSMLTAFVGSLIGAVAVQFFDAATLEFLIPLVMVLILIYFVASPKPSAEDSQAKISQSTYRATAVPVVGFYDGMFGPATGSFFVLAGVTLRGQSIINATVVAKTLNFATNVASLLVFFWFGEVAIAIGLLMMIGQFVGARIGANTLMSINPNALRGLVVLMCVVMLAFWLTGR